MGTFVADLDRLTVEKKQEITKDEPYLWIYGLVVDTNTLQTGQYVFGRPCLPSALGVKLAKDESCTIPNSLGRFSHTMTPLLGVGACGFVVIAWEHDTTPDSSIQTAYDNVRDILNTAIVDYLRTNGISISGNFTNALATGVMDDVIAEVKKQFIDGMSIFRLNPDDYIGIDYSYFAIASNAARNRSLSLTLSKKDTMIYRITGTMTYTP